MNQNQPLRLGIVFSVAAVACLLWWPVSCQVLTVLRTPCLNSSTAAWTSGQPNARSLEECFWRSRQPVADLQSIGLVQFDRRYLTCALHRYRDVCHLLNLTALATAGNQHQVTSQQDCVALVDSEYDPLTANAYFAAVWVGGHGPALENLVCGPSGPRNPVVSIGVSWTPEGAQMDGASSQLLVNDPTGFDFSSSFTMAVELKRRPGGNAFLEVTECATFSNAPHSLWEFDAIGRPVMCARGANRIESIGQLITNNSNEFFKVAATRDMVGNRAKLFYGLAALPEFAVRYTATCETGTGPVGKCLKIGYRSTNVGTLNGTVRMAAIANSFLPDDVVLRFLSGN